MSCSLRDLTLDDLSEISKLFVNNGIDYIVWGGGACYALGGGRSTIDLDVIIRTTPQDSIQNKINALVSAGNGSFTWDEGTQSLSYKTLPIDAFPTDVWVDTPRYLDFFDDGSTEQVDINGVKVRVLLPKWLLREKLHTFAHRGKSTKKAGTDFQDITFLAELCDPRSLDLRTNDAVNIAAKEGLKIYLEMWGRRSDDSDEAPILQVVQT